MDVTIYDAEHDVRRPIRQPDVDSLKAHGECLLILRTIMTRIAHRLELETIEEYRDRLRAVRAVADPY